MSFPPCTETVIFKEMCIRDRFLKSHIRLELAAGAVLAADTDRFRYPRFPGMIESCDETEDYNLGTWEGNPLPMFAGIINGIEVEDVDVYKRQLTGFEFAAGIPGTVGGAVVMNAGAYGSETKDILESVRVMTMEGEEKVLSLPELELGYRTSCIPANHYICLLYTSRCV